MIDACRGEINLLEGILKMINSQALHIALTPCRQRMAKDTSNLDEAEYGNTIVGVYLL